VTVQRLRLVDPAGIGPVREQRRICVGFDDLVSLPIGVDPWGMSIKEDVKR
jgi:hypothetical protein